MAEVQTKRNMAEETRRRELAIIHMARKQMGMDDDTYRECLRNLTGVESAALLDAAGRKKVITYFKASGYGPVHQSAKASGMDRQPSRQRSPLLSKIGAILAELRLPWSYADGISKHMFKVDSVRWLGPEQLLKVTQALIYRQIKLRQGKGK